LAFSGGVLDPNTTPDFANPVFKYVNLNVSGTLNYDLAGLPGRSIATYNWSNKPKVDLAAPLGGLSPLEIVGCIKGFATDCALNRKNESYCDRQLRSIST
jgi:hypothetical protein